MWQDRLVDLALPASVPTVITALIIVNVVFSILATAAFHVSARSTSWSDVLTWQLLGNLAGLITVLAFTGLLRYVPLSIAFPVTTGMSILGHSSRILGGRGPLDPPRPLRGGGGSARQAEDPPHGGAGWGAVSGDRARADREAARHPGPAAQRLPLPARSPGAGPRQSGPPALGASVSIAAGAIDARYRPAHRAGRASDPLVLPRRARVPEDPPARRAAARGVRRHPEPRFPQLRVLVELVRSVLSVLAGAPRSRAGVPLSPPFSPAAPVGRCAGALAPEGPPTPPWPARAMRRLSRRERDRDASGPPRGRRLGRELARRSPSDVQSCGRPARGRTGGVAHARRRHPPRLRGT